MKSLSIIVLNFAVITFLVGITSCSKHRDSPARVAWDRLISAGPEGAPEVISPTESYVTKEDAVYFAAFIDDKREVPSFFSTESSQWPSSSTAGVQAQYLILGYLMGKFPPLVSHLDINDEHRKEIRAWCDMHAE